VEKTQMQSITSKGDWVNQFHTNGKVVRMMMGALDGAEE
jgi:hypothetical protein